ncbi:uncharacterized protein LOC143301522 isoform X2 [Babylonia areolata]|uniref:uncharacterized protein LOC143301522 isoform X2 n=1 Tax=Babylonia areolata TaxID=304850 RepID=UPI003FD1BD5A
MGKEHELLEAARTGNLPVVKTIVSGKLPRSGSGSGGLTGGLRSLLALKHVNINCKDTSGETPLHLSALNGHGEVVQVLLAAKAIVTEVDCQGCTPLHLSAWNGHANICDILLQHTSDKSIVNAQTNEGETPLHFAAQHGHLDVVSLLLQNKADPTYRTLAERSALDLAAQYGKTGVVRTLVTGRHELLTHVAGQPSPLHLAAFNGHLPIVGFLLDSGFPVNTRTDNGTALHEAATSCKLDVIKLLLDRGVDVWAKAKNDMTAEDILKSTHSKLTHEALQIISGHVNSQRTPDSDGERDINGIPGPGHAGEATPPSGGRPVPKPRSMYGNGVGSALFMESNRHRKKYRSTHSCPSEPQSPPPPIPPRISIRSVDTPPKDVSPAVDTGGQDSAQLTARAEAAPSRSRDASPMSGSREQPKKPPRKTPSMRKTDHTHTTTTTITTTTTTTTTSTSGSEPSTSVRDEPGRHPSGCETDPVPVDHVTTDPDQVTATVAQDMDPAPSLLVETGHTDRGEGGGEGPGGLTQAQWTERGEGDSEEVEGAGGEAVPVCVKRESIYANATIIAAEEETKVGKPQRLLLDEGSAESTETAADEGDAAELLRGYTPPPTPDYPPPSPNTAAQGIQQTIYPQARRQSKDMETATESAAPQDTPALPSAIPQDMEGAVAGGDRVVGAVARGSPVRRSAHGEQRLPQDYSPVPKERGGSRGTPPKPTARRSRGSSSGSSSSVMTVSDDGATPHTPLTPLTPNTPNTVKVEGEEVQMRPGRSVSEWDSVFAGLLKGSTPGGSRNVVSQICENVVVKTVRSKHRSTPSTIVTFDPLMEREESPDVFDADRVLGEIEEMTGGSGAASRGRQQTGRDSARKADDNFDDSEEWAKIADIVSSYGGRISSSGDYLHVDFSQDFDSQLGRLLTGRGGHHMIQSVGEWLDSLGLGQYENTLVANGFDDTDFLGGSIVEGQDLADIGITNEDHRTAIVNAAQRLPPVQPIDQRMLPESVSKWLDTLRLGQYLDTFVSHKYNTMLRVIKLWELELSTVLDISSVGHRKRILASLGDRRHLEHQPSVSPARSWRRESEEDEPRSPFDHINLYRDYTGVKAQVSDSGEPSSPQHAPRTAPDKAEENGPASPQVTRDNQIHIRPPHLMHTTGSIKQWRHRPEVLIKGCCNYTAHYLGSTVVKELKGATSTQEGIAKLKQRLRRKLQKSTEVISKIPTIMLSISYKGVKFIDAKSKRVICDHEIANIFCACQDGDHMNFFAYVTKDKETSRHYCHVFSVRSREQAGEIILTLGEAFEIAYQMALKERAEEEAGGVGVERQVSHSDQDDTTSQSSRASVSTV